MGKIGATTKKICCTFISGPEILVGVGTVSSMTRKQNTPSAQASTHCGDDLSEIGTLFLTFLVACFFLKILVAFIHLILYIAHVYRKCSTYLMAKVAQFLLILMVYNSFFPKKKNLCTSVTLMFVSLLDFTVLFLFLFFFNKFM